jgi:hypothetical protein
VNRAVSRAPASIAADVKFWQDHGDEVVEAADELID